MLPAYNVIDKNKTEKLEKINSFQNLVFCIFLIMTYSTTLFPYILLAADASSSKKAENPFYECLSGDVSNPKKFCNT